jgi:hypothetical protein
MVEQLQLQLLAKIFVQLLGRIQLQLFGKFQSVLIEIFGQLQLFEFLSKFVGKLFLLMHDRVP